MVTNAEAKETRTAREDALEREDRFITKMKGERVSPGHFIVRLAHFFKDGFHSSNVRISQRAICLWSVVQYGRVAAGSGHPVLFRPAAGQTNVMDSGPCLTECRQSPELHRAKLKKANIWTSPIEVVIAGRSL